MRGEGGPPIFFGWNPNIFVTFKPMQNFRTLPAFFLVEKKGPRKKEERKKNNAIKYGHYVLPMHAKGQCKHSAQTNFVLEILG